MHSFYEISYQDKIREGSHSCSGWHAIFTPISLRQADFDKSNNTHKCNKPPRLHDTRKSNPGRNIEVIDVVLLAVGARSEQKQNYSRYKTAKLSQMDFREMSFMFYV